jgi:hypothetical protein
MTQSNRLLNATTSALRPRKGDLVRWHMRPARVLFVQRSEAFGLTSVRLKLETVGVEVPGWIDEDEVGILARPLEEEDELRVLPWVPVPDMVPIAVRDLVSSNGDKGNSLGAYVHVYPLARTGSAVKFCAEIYAQLKVKRPNQHFLLADVSEV